MKRKHLFQLFKQLIILLDMGLNLNQSMKICINLNPDPDFKKRLKHLYQDLELGENLIDALKKQDLDTWTLNLLHFSLETQQLKSGFNLYVQQYQNRLKLKKILRQQLFYPSVLLLLSLMILVLLSQQILPAYQHLYHQFDMRLPKSLIVIQQKLHFYGLLLPLGLGIIMSLYPKLTFFLPIIGKLIKRYHWSKWFSLMHMGLASGMTFHQSLILIAPEIKNSQLHAWHQQLIHELQLGCIELHHITPPHCLPPILHPYFYLLSYHKDSAQICKKAYRIIKQQVQDDLMKIQQYLQPTMLFLVSLFCSYLLYLFYQPILHLQQIL